MAYKIKRKEPDYAELELKHFVAEHHRKKPKFLEITREGTRQAVFVPEISHRKGVLVYYQNKLHAVTKVTPQGIWLQPFSEKGAVFEENGENPKPIFVKESDYEKQVEPIFTATPFYLSPTIAGEFPKKWFRNMNIRTFK